MTKNISEQQLNVEFAIALQSGKYDLITGLNQPGEYVTLPSTVVGDAALHDALNCMKLKFMDDPSAKSLNAMEKLTVVILMQLYKKSREQT